MTISRIGKYEITIRSVEAFNFPIISLQGVSFDYIFISIISWLIITQIECQILNPDAFIYYF